MNLVRHLSIALLLLILVKSLSHAREAYLRDVPSPFACTTCHQDPRLNRQGANIRNGFGFDYVAQRQDWSRLCTLDSDGDGITNAEELLDPDCLWRPAPPGQPNTPRPSGRATHPGDPDDPDQCGDGEIQGRETCDGDNLNGVSCESLGYLAGQLACNQSCQFDVTDCVPVPEPDMRIPDALLPDLQLPDAQPMNPDSAFDGLDAHVDAVVPDMADEDVNVSDADRLTDLTPKDAEPVADADPYDASSLPIARDASTCTQASDIEPVWLVMIGVLVLRRSRRMFIIH